MVPTIRIQACNSAAVRGDGDYVLYWMIAFRRLEWNFSLQHAVEWAVELRKPLVIFEPLRIGYPWASDRFHRFVIDGMADNTKRIAAAAKVGVMYFPYVEPTRDAGKGLLRALAERASVVITDNYPSFFLPRMMQAAAARLSVRLEQVDSNGLLPLQATARVFSTAYSFRSYLQKELPPHLMDSPQPDPLSTAELPPLRALPPEITRRWPATGAKLLAESPAAIAELPIDHSVGLGNQRGGPSAARQRLQNFLHKRVATYAEAARDPDAKAGSGLSPYLHFGHISSHQLFHELMQQEQWTPEMLDHSTRGKRAGWWGVGPGAEAWLDQFVTWRELGYNMAVHQADYDCYQSLPAWALKTLAKHSADRREHAYTLDEFAAPATHDELWNAAQTQLVREGCIHNYLRMLWGKKILEWSNTPQEALDVMIELNNRFALDGRDPNSYSGIFWVLGRYDRAWGPERSVFGTVRYMSSQNTRRKLHVEKYLALYGALTSGHSAVKAIPI
jgi:deoxyribodipyrimidine photo-lyase